MPHVPDTVPGKRVTGAGARTEGREASRQTSEVGAVCGQAARTVLCGGRPVMGVPTAIARQVTGSRLRPSLGPIDRRRGGIIRTVVGLGKTNRAVSAASRSPLAAA